MVWFQAIRRSSCTVHPWLASARAVTGSSSTARRWVSPAPPRTRVASAVRLCGFQAPSGSASFSFVRQGALGER